MKKSILALTLLFSAFILQGQENEIEQEQLPQNSSFLFKAVDFITTAPYLLNIGCEPTVNNGAKTFGSFEYKWTDSISSQIYFEKGADLAFEENIIKNSSNYVLEDLSYITKTSDYFGKIFPYKQFFGKDSAIKHSLGIGFAAEYLKARIDSNEIIQNTVYDDHYATPPAVDKWFYAQYKSASEETNLLIGPCIEFNLSIPLTSWLTFNAENTLVPVYFYKLDLKHSYQYTGFNSGDQQMFSDYAFSTGIAKLKYHLDIVKKLGLVVNYEFARICDYTVGFNSTDGSLFASRYMKTNNTLRVGAALLSTTDTFVRIQTGFYREYLWMESSVTKEKINTKSWVLSVSVGF